MGLNSKYIKITNNQILETKFLKPFQTLYPIRKQAYMLELNRKQKIHKVFYILLLEQYTTKKMQVNKNVIRLDFEPSNNKNYKVEEI